MNGDVENCKAVTSSPHRVSGDHINPCGKISSCISKTFCPSKPLTTLAALSGSTVCESVCASVGVVLLLLSVFVVALLVLFVAM